MRTNRLRLIVAALVYFPAFAATATPIQEPLLTISGHYRVGDGRVKEHKFPVEIKLSADGHFTGIYETWLEARLDDGTTKLGYFNTGFLGTWKMADNTILLILSEGTEIPEFTFEATNGLSIKFVRKEDGGNAKRSN